MCVETIALAALLLRTAACLAPEQAGRFVASFRATFGGQSIRQVVAAVMPTASSTTSHLLRTPVGTVSLFGFSTPIPCAFGAERTGYLIADIGLVALHRLAGSCAIG